jgi:hypothetical protein
MKYTLVSASLIVAIGFATMSEAAAWTRSGTLTTRRGTYYSQASGGCSAGTCSRSRSITGPHGGTVSRTGSITRTGDHSYSYSRTTTGPNGSSVTRSGTAYRYD